MADQHRKRTATLALVGCLFLVACESDADKLSRLTKEQAISCLRAQRMTTEAEKAADNSPDRDSLYALASAQDVKCKLATRDYERMLR